VLRIPVWSSDERGRRVPVSVVAVCRRRQRPEWTWSLGPVKCVDGNKWRQLSLVSWRGAVVERRSVYSCSRRHCVWWTTRSEEHCQHWSLFRVVKLICLTALLFEHLWNLGLQYIDSARIDFRVWVIDRWVEQYCMFMLYALCITFVFYKKITRKLIDVWMMWNLLMCSDSQNATNTWHLYLCPFLETHIPVRPVDGFSRMMYQTKRTRAKMSFLGICSHDSPFRGKNQFWGVNRRFQAKLAKSKNMHNIKTTASIPTKFCTVIKTTKCPS